MNRLLRIAALVAPLMVLGLQGAARAELVVVVNPQSQVAQLSAQEVEDLFLAKKQKLPSGEKAMPIDQAQAEIKEAFYSKVANKNLAQLKAYWSKLIFTGKATPLTEVPTDAEVIAAVAATPGAIGYINKEAVTEQVKPVMNLP